MNVKKPILAGLIGLTTLTPMKAQKPVQLVSETGITGLMKDEASFYTGMNFEFLRGKNYTDLYGGITVKPDQSASFVGLIINNYPWTKNISSWARETFVASKGVVKSTLQIAPVKANTKAGKFNFSMSPSYVLYNDFKEGSTRQGVAAIFQTTYSMTPNDVLFFEGAYASEPSKNLFHTHFGNFKDNFSYMFSYMRKINTGCKFKKLRKKQEKYGIKQ